MTKAQKTGSLPWVSLKAAILSSLQIADIQVASYYCTYAKMWVKVKSVYDLTVTSDEKAALVEMLATC